MADLSDWRIQYVGKTTEPTKLSNGSKTPAGSTVFVGLEGYWEQGRKIEGPMPSPIAIYLSAAIDNYESAKKIRSELSELEGSFGEKTSEFFNFIENYFASVVLSAMAVEAFANLHISESDTYTHTRHDKKCTEVYRGIQIERHVSWDEKLAVVVAKKLNSNIDKSKVTWANYKTLFKIRDRLVHLKNKDRESHSVDDDTIWTLALTSDLFDPRKAAIEIMCEFFTENNILKWLQYARTAL